MLRFIFYIVVFYIVMKILRIFIDPVFDKHINNKPNQKTPEKKPIVGEYIEYEEVKN